MTPDRSNRIQSLAEEAQQLAPDLREEFLLKSCGDDANMLEEVYALLEEGMSTLVDGRIFEALLAESDIQERQIGPYKIQHEIGRGGMGIVYRAVDTRLGRSVAIKCLAQQLKTNLDARDRFLGEARAASQLDHPNICAIYDIGATDTGQQYIVMPFFDGQDLHTRLKTQQFSVSEALYVVHEVCQALHVAHDEGIFHRDIKPGNIFITHDNQVKLLDFGIAKVVNNQITQTGAVMGTLAYMSPEQMRGEEVDHRTDLWSLGVILFEMLTGNNPFRGELPHEVMHSVLNTKLTASTSNRQLDQFLSRLIASDRAKRFSSAKDIIEAIDQLDQNDLSNPIVVSDSGKASYTETVQFDPELLQRVTEELTKHLGPIAKVMVKKHQKSVNGITDLANLLAPFLPNQNAREAIYKIVSKEKPSFNSEFVQSQTVVDESEDLPLDDVVLREIEAILITSIGPIARPLVKRQAKQNSNFDALCLQLSEHIDNLHIRDQFIIKTQQLKRDKNPA